MRMDGRYAWYLLLGVIRGGPSRKSHWALSAAGSTNAHPVVFGARTITTPMALRTPEQHFPVHWLQFGAMQSHSTCRPQALWRMLHKRLTRLAHFSGGVLVATRMLSLN